MWGSASGRSVMPEITGGVAPAGGVIGVGPGVAPPTGVVPVAGGVIGVVPGAEPPLLAARRLAKKIPPTTARTSRIKKTRSPFMG